MEECMKMLEKQIEINKNVLKGGKDGKNRRLF